MAGRDTNRGDNRLRKKLYPNRMDVLRSIQSKKSDSFIDENDRLYTYTPRDNENYQVRSSSYPEGEFIMMDFALPFEKQRRGFGGKSSNLIPEAGEIIELRRYSPDGSVGKVTNVCRVEEVISEKRRASGQVVLTEV